MQSSLTIWKSHGTLKEDRNSGFSKWPSLHQVTVKLRGISLTSKWRGFGINRVRNGKVRLYKLYIIAYIIEYQPQLSSFLARSSTSVNMNSLSYFFFFNDSHWPCARLLLQAPLTDPCTTVWPRGILRRNLSARKPESHQCTSASSLTPSGILATPHWAVRSPRRYGVKIFVKLDRDNSTSYICPAFFGRLTEKSISQGGRMCRSCSWSQTGIATSFKFSRPPFGIWWPAYRSVPFSSDSPPPLM